MAMITVGAVDWPNPTDYEVTLSDLDSENTLRVESGLLTRDRIRAGVYRIDASFLVTKAELKTITDSITASSFSVTFFDPTTSSTPTATMYSGDRKCKLSLHKDEAHPEYSMWEFSVALVEY